MEQKDIIHLANKTDERILDTAREKLAQNKGKSERDMRFGIKSLGNGVATIY